MNRKQWKGSFTVEAALVVPLLLLCTGFLITMALYAHDRSVIVSTAYEVAGKGAYWFQGKDGDVSSRMEEEGRQLLKDQLLLVQTVEIKAGKSLTGMEVTIHADTGNVLFGSITVKRTVPKISPASFIRGYGNIFGKDETDHGEDL